MKIIPYVYDFVSLIFDNAEAKKYIRNIILFGSAATGEADKESDIDIFINTSDDAAKKVEAIVKDAEKRFYLLVEKKWALLGIDLPIKCIVADLDRYHWKEIKSEIISAGIVLYGKYEGVKEGLKHYSLFTYSTSRLSQNKKMQFIRKMFGYKTRIRNKAYEKKGLVPEISGLKLGDSILIPVEKSKEIQQIMAGFKITPEIREVWTKE